MLVKNPKDRISPAELLKNDPWINRYAEKSELILCQPCRVVIEKINLENLRKQYKGLTLKKSNFVVPIEKVDSVAKVSCKPCKVVINRRHLNEISKEYKNLKIRASISDRLKGHLYF